MTGKVEDDAFFLGTRKLNILLFPLESLLVLWQLQMLLDYLRDSWFIDLWAFLADKSLQKMEREKNPAYFAFTNVSRCPLFLM